MEEIMPRSKVKDKMIACLARLERGGYQCFDDIDIDFFKEMYLAITDDNIKTVERQIAHFKKAGILPDIMGLSEKDMHSLYKEHRRPEKRKTEYSKFMLDFEELKKKYNLE